jgi:lysophospholipase L1-like esterase
MVLKEILNNGYSDDDPQYWVVEEGLGGRTTCREDPVEGDRNGLRQLVPILESHKPLDIVVVMLGTNDLKIRYSPCAYDIAWGVNRIVTAIKDSRTGPDNSIPKVLVVCPPPVLDTPVLRGILGNCMELSSQLPNHYRQFSEESKVNFLDAGTVIKSSPIDGVHLEIEDHRKLAKAIAAIIQTM